MQNAALKNFEIPLQPAAPMRVLLDARKLRDGGIGTYIENLICGLINQPGVELTLLAHPEIVEEYDWADEVGLIEERARPYSPDELFRLARRVDFSRYDLFHEPHWTVPFGIPVPAVITLHDLIHVNHPERFYYPAVARPLIRSALRRAARIIAVSRSTAREIGALVGNSRVIMEKVAVIPNAVDAHMFHRSTGAGAGLGPYLLAVCSTPKPHKGVPELLEAFARVRASAHSDPELKLILAGAGARREIWAGRVRAELLERVIFRGHVPRETLTALYAGARALVVASRVEGFSLPVLEAQACGITVVTTPIPAVGEIVSPRDIVCRDFTPAAIAAGIDAALRGAASGALPREHFERFDRDLVAERVASLYRAAIGGDETV